ncbi:hypothetical protein AZ025_004687, partial [Escherichia coli]
LYNKCSNKLVVNRCPCNLKILSFFVKCNNHGNYILRATSNQE